MEVRPWTLKKSWSFNNRRLALPNRRRRCKMPPPPDRTLLEASSISTTGYAEAQLVVLLLSVVVVAVALLSYFVVAPEYEKHLDKQYAALVRASSERQLQLQKAHEFFTRSRLRKHKSLGAWDMESGSSDDDGRRQFCSAQRRHSYLRPSPADMARDGISMAAQIIARRERNARRRKSESDALKQANIQRAEMLRRRVLLRKLEEEIAGAVKANEEAQAAATSGSLKTGSGGGSRRVSNNTLDLSDDQLKMLQDHPADCVEELTVLARAQSQQIAASPAAVDDADDDATRARSLLTMETGPDLHEVKQALHVLHNVLSFYLSVDHRDMTKLTVFCNSLLQHDGLNRLRAFEGCRDKDVRVLSNSIIEKAVPAIWH